MSRPSFNPSRRQFVKTGVAGSVFLAAGAGLAGCAKPSTSDSSKGLQWLTDKDVAMFTALIPVVLGLNPASAEIQQAILKGMDNTLLHTNASGQAEVRQLFDLLQFAPTRTLTTGVWRDWPKAKRANVEDFLNDWRSSSLDLFRTGFRAFHDLITGVYYSQPAGWAHMGYPGPPQFYKYMLTGKTPIVR